MKITIYLAETAQPVVAKCRATVEILGCAFRAPHHSCSPESVAGEVALAAGGVLLLDEAADFRRTAYEALLRALGAAPLAGRAAPAALVLQVAREDLDRLEKVAASLLLVAREAGKVEILDGGVVR